MRQDNRAFREARPNRTKNMRSDKRFAELSEAWMRESINQKYSYNFEWLGLPIIQYPSDLIAMQELIWNIKPKNIVETGVARGGSLIFYASMLRLCGEPGHRVIGVELDLAETTRSEIQGHQLSDSLVIVDGSSIEPSTFAKVEAALVPGGPTLVVLDSNHGHAHVLEELRLYSSLVEVGSYLVVFDTIIEQLSPDLIVDRPWGPGDSPFTAISSFLKTTSDFEICDAFNSHLMHSVCPAGYLRRVR